VNVVSSIKMRSICPTLFATALAQSVRAERDLDRKRAEKARGGAIRRSVIPQAASRDAAATARASGPFPRPARRHLQADQAVRRYQVDRARGTDVVFERDRAARSTSMRRSKSRRTSRKFLAIAYDEIFAVRRTIRELPADRLDESDC
jgi:hypothetical protein